MWGRWSYIGEGKAGNMFNQLLTSHHVTKTAIQEALRCMKKSGITKPELEAFFMEILSKNKSSLAFCSDEEALVIDRVISTVLAGEYNGLLNVLVQRYRYRKSKRSLAEELQMQHPELDVHDLPPSN
jgi:hypothetical protein